MTDDQDSKGPDLAAGLPEDSLPEGAMLAGHVGDAAVLLARVGDEVFAIGAQCSHYQGPLAEGLLIGDTVRCPWHHACFSLRTGAPLRPPARDSVGSWRVERRDGSLFVREKRPRPTPEPLSGGPKAIVIVGGGPAAQVAAETLRREGFAGRLTMLSADAAPPCDRPNLSKDYLAGNAEADWIPLRPGDFYEKQQIELHLGARVAAIDPRGKEVRLEDGTRHSFDVALLATGAVPVRLDIPGADLPHVRTLRSVADSDALIGAAEGAKQVVVIGASFIGLEVAASLRARKLAVHVVAPEHVPMERTLGPELGALVRRIHEQHGVTFHLGTTAASIEAGSVPLKDGTRLEADLVVVGVGVRPDVALADAAGLTVDNGVVVNPYLESSAPGIFAAGDIARWPDRLSGEHIRVEHFVVAERQGQTAARNMLGRRERFDAVPFFWSQHYDTTIAYVGHASRWERVEIAGSIADADATVTYLAGGRKLAVAAVGRDLDSLRAEAELERMIAR